MALEEPVREPRGAHAAEPAPGKVAGARSRRRGGGRRRVARWVAVAAGALLLAVLALAAASWLGLLRLPDPVQDAMDLLPDPNARAIQSDDGGEVPDGNFRLVLNQAMAADAGSRLLPVAFQNPEANAYAARLEVEMDGATVASSRMVAPGMRLDRLRCDRPLEEGEHAATVRVLLYEEDAKTSELVVDAVVTAR